MASRNFRDRFFTPPVARAVTSPSGILAFGGGAAAAIVLTGIAAITGPVIAPIALVGGALAYAGRVALAIPRKEHSNIDPFSVKEPWRHAVVDATVARKRFDEAVQTFKSGPLRESLTAMGEQLDTAVDQCWRIARQGQLMADARLRIDDREVQFELDRVTGSLAPGATPSPTQARTIASLQAQLATADRMDHLIASTRDELDLLNARLDQSVTQAIELSVSNRAGGLDPLSSQLDDIVEDLSSLRAAFEDVDGGDPSLPADLDQIAGEPPGTATSPPGGTLPPPPPPPPASRSGA